MTEQLPLLHLLITYGSFFGCGVVLGCVFLWGLWLTVNRLPGARHPALLMLTSLFLRLGLTLACFWGLTLYGGPWALLSAVAGFTLPRLAAARRMGELNRRQEVTQP